MAKSAREAAPDGQMLRGLLDTLVLEVLREGDNYGFGILQRVSARTGEEDSLLKDATLYPLLHRLEAKTLVESYFQPGERGTPRKYYHLTKTGQALLEERIEEWKRIVRVLDRALFKGARK